MKKKPTAKKGLKAAQEYKENLSPWLEEISELNKEINALCKRLVKAENVIEYLESKLGLKP